MDILSRHAKFFARRADAFRESVEVLAEFDAETSTRASVKRAEAMGKKYAVDIRVTNMEDPRTREKAKDAVFGRCDGCEGFVLKHDMKCTSCEKVSCDKCAKVISSPDHQCSPEDVKSLEAIRKSCVSCPKCSVPVFKSSGCNQMFCTSCKTPFCWRTGEVLNLKYFHNPHHQQWLNTREGRESEQRANVNLAQCGVIGYANLSALQQAGISYSRARKMVDLHCNIRDSEHVQIQVARDVTAMAWIRARYMNGEISEKEFRRKITIEQKRVDKRRELAQIYAMFVAISGDVIRLLARGEEADFNQTIEFTNEAIESLNVHYGNGKNSWKIKPIDP